MLATVMHIRGTFQEAQGNLSASEGDAGDIGLIPGLGKSPGGGNGSPLQFSCLEDPVYRGAWKVTACGVTKSRTRLSMYSAHVGHEHNMVHTCM